jgi:hypothetical protein
VLLLVKIGVTRNAKYLITGILLRVPPICIFRHLSCNNPASTNGGSINYIPIVTMEIILYSKFCAQNKEQTRCTQGNLVFCTRFLRVKQGNFLVFLKQGNTLFPCLVNKGKLFPSCKQGEKFSLVYTLNMSHFYPLP